MECTPVLLGWLLGVWGYRGGHSPWWGEFSEPGKKIRDLSVYNMTIFDQLKIFAHFNSFLLIYGRFFCHFWPKINSGIFHSNFQNQEIKYDPMVYNMTIFVQLKILTMWGLFCQYLISSVLMIRPFIKQEKLYTTWQLILCFALYCSLCIIRTGWPRFGIILEFLNFGRLWF